MLTIRRWLVALAVCLGVLSVPSISWADDPSLAKPKDAKAREHLAQGNALYNVRKFDEAATEYVAGAVVEAAPVFDYNLGQCYRQLGKYQDAIWHYERFLNYGHPGDERSFVVGFVSQMKDELAKKAMTQPPTGPAADNSAPPATPVVRTDAASTSVVERGDAGERWYSDGVGWGLTGAGVVGIGAAGTLFLSASSLKDDANATAGEDRRIELRGRADDRILVGTMVGVAAGALVISGVIKLAIHASPRSRSRSAWDFRITSRSIAVSGRF